MECLKNFNNALEVISYNIDLAYSMLVYCLEALCQSLNETTPQWEQYNEKIRREIDEQLRSVEPTIAENVRAALLKESHVQLQTKFLDFTLKHINNSFYLEEAFGLKFAARPSHLRQALKNAYSLRSKYVHTLQKIQDQLRIQDLADGDMFIWNNEPYLTLGGLHRVVRHVISQFIQVAEAVDTEELNWQEGLPGQVTLKLAPNYWIANHENISVPMKKEQLGPLVNAKFWGLADLLQSDGKSLPDFRELLNKYEKLTPNATSLDKIRMLCTYWLYNTLITPEYRSPNHEKFLKNYEAILQECNLETIFCCLFLFNKLSWTYEVIDKIYSQFCIRRFSNNIARPGLRFEIALLAAIANKAKSEGKNAEFLRYVKMARLEASGHSKMQTYLQACELNDTAITDKVISEVMNGNIDDIFDDLSSFPGLNQVGVEAAPQPAVLESAKAVTATPDAILEAKASAQAAPENSGLSEVASTRSEPLVNQPNNTIANTDKEDVLEAEVPPPLSLAIHDSVNNDEKEGGSS